MGRGPQARSQAPHSATPMRSPGSVHDAQRARAATGGQTDTGVLRVRNSSREEFGAAAMISAGGSWPYTCSGRESIPQSFPTGETGAPPSSSPSVVPTVCGRCPSSDRRARTSETFSSPSLQMRTFASRFAAWRPLASVTSSARTPLWSLASRASASRKDVRCCSLPSKSNSNNSSMSAMYAHSRSPSIQSWLSPMLP